MKSNEQLDSAMTSQTEYPIVADHISKQFILWRHREQTLKSTLINLIRSRDLSRDVLKSLDDVSFKVKRGETLGIIGHNGSGKTTLLRVLAGIVTPTSGTLKVEGRVSTLFELGTGFHSELSGRENIYLNGTILGLTRQEVDRKYDQIVAFAELENFIDSPLKHYSSGMQMRLAFSVAISIEPEVLLVDEVLAVGDAAFQSKSYSAFQDFKKRGTTIVFVTHDLGAVNANCDRAILMDHGQIVAEGRPNKVIEVYRGDVDKKMHGDGETGGEAGRWGDRKATVEKIWVENETGEHVTTVENNKPVTVKVRYKFHYDAVDPIFGLTIESRDGRAVIIDNTLWQGRKTGSYRNGESIVVTYQLPNVFERGYYLLSPNIAETATQMHDHRTGMMEFFAQKPYLTAGAFNPEMTIEFNHND